MTRECGYAGCRCETYRMIPSASQRIRKMCSYLFQGLFRLEWITKAMKRSDAQYCSIANVLRKSIIWFNREKRHANIFAPVIMIRSLQVLLRIFSSKYFDQNATLRSSLHCSVHSLLEKLEHNIRFTRKILVSILPSIRASYGLLRMEMRQLILCLYRMRSHMAQDSLKSILLLVLSLLHYQHPRPYERPGWISSLDLKISARLLPGLNLIEDEILSSDPVSH